MNDILIYLLIGLLIGVPFPWFSIWFLKEEANGCVLCFSSFVFFFLWPFACIGYIVFPFIAIINDQPSQLDIIHKCKWKVDFRE